MKSKMMKNEGKQNMTLNAEKAVSPVVGVMLMLVVVIIIAAVVSAFSGGLVGSHQNAPHLSMNVQIANSGFYTTSFFSAEVTGVDGAISTNNLKLDYLMEPCHAQWYESDRWCDRHSGTNKHSIIL